MAEREIILGDAIYYDGKGPKHPADRGRQLYGTRGQVIDISKEEIERLEALGAVGPVGTVADLDAQPGADGVLSDLSDEELATWSADHKVDEVVGAAGTVELAQRLLDIEEARDEPRKGVTDGISKALGALG